MKYFSALTMIFFLITGVVSCQPKPVKKIFISNQIDSATGLKETKIYKLKEQTINSDFDNSKLNNIDDNIKDTLTIKNLMPIFEPVAGHYKYYQFISTFKGLACCDGDGLKIFHDILIIKTDDLNKIIGAYQYTLEWAEPPLQYDLYKSSEKGLTLDNNIDISKLKFIRTDYWNDKDRLFKEGGIIKLR